LTTDCETRICCCNSLCKQNKTNLVSLVQRKSWTTSVMTKDATSTMHSVSDAYSSPTDQESVQQH
jgi:hypothetical protein